MPDVPEQLDFLLSVDRLISAADEARRKRDRLLKAGQVPAADKTTGDKQDAKSRGQAMKTGPHKPAKRAPAVIRAGELYSLVELRRRLQWQEHAVRQARVSGLRLVTFGRAKYALGSDVLKFFERLADQQAGIGAAGAGETLESRLTTSAGSIPARPIIERMPSHD